MNALLAFGRLALAHREKVLLAVMALLCGALAGLTFLPRSNAEAGEDVDIAWDKEPRTIQTFERVHIQNERPLDEVRARLGRNIFRPGGAPGPIGEGDLGIGPVVEAWPNVIVRRVSQPTPGGAWIAQLEVDGRMYIAREGKGFANNQFELQRIDKTRLCVEVLRRLDDEVREFCQE